MIFKIIRLGWKNVWRNPTRSGVVIVAVLLGIWAGAFISAFTNGMIQDYLHNQLDLSVGHIQVTHPRFEDQFDPQFHISGADSLLQTLHGLDYVTQVRPQSLSTGLAQSAANSYGVTIHGLTASADTLHPVRGYHREGTFLPPGVRNPVSVGQSLADRLDLRLNSRIVLSFQDLEGTITAGSFRVSGIFSTSNNTYDKGNVFVARGDLNRLLGEENLIHKVTLKLDQFDEAEQRRSQISALYPGLKVSSWGELAPELRYVYSMMDLTLYIIMVIIIIALVFSIINTMLMSILERTRELGMLMAVGMNKVRLFLMILTETFFLTMVGTPLGLLLSWGTIRLTANTGIDLGPFAQGLNAFGMSSVIYPELPLAYYLNIALMISIAALFSAIFPAWKTLKLNPVEAIRKI